jgi:hypothetical protein
LSLRLVSFLFLSELKIMSAVEAKEPGFFTKGVKEKTSDSEWVRYAMSNRIPLCTAGRCALPAPHGCAVHCL